MVELRPSTDVRPVTEFRANTSAVLDQVHAFLSPVEEVYFDFGTASLLESGNLTCSKRRGIPVHGYDRVTGP